MSFPTFPRWVMHDVKDCEQLYVANKDGTTELNLVTTALINSTMVIGVNKITDDNVDDVSCRIALLQSIYGTLLFVESEEDKKPIFITRDDVARHIGLETEAKEIELASFWAQMRNFNRQENCAGLREAQR